MEGAGGVELSPLFPQLVGLRVHIYSTIIDFGSLEFNWKSLDGTGASIDNGVKPSADFPQLLGLNLMEVAGWYWSQVQFFHNYLA